MTPAPRIIRADDIAAAPWRNGGGMTRELLVVAPPAVSARASGATTGAGGSGGAHDWALRISLADIDTGGPFSVFVGVDRWFCVVDGPGVQLDMDGSGCRIGPGDAPLHFSGETPVHCSLPSGPTRDLNLMTTIGAGLMQPAVAACVWRGVPSQRGLFTRVAGVWSDDRGRRIALSARTLLWEVGVSGHGWRFDPTGAAPPIGPPGWWLGYAPEAGDARG